MTSPETVDTGYVYSIAAVKNFEGSGETYFGATILGLLRSADGGVTWNSAYRTSELMPPTPIMAIAAAQNADSRHVVVAGLRGAILRSVNGGRNWDCIYLPSPPPTVSAIAISPIFDTDGVMFATTLDDGVFCTKDHGQSWNAWNFGLLDRCVLSLSISPDYAIDSTLFAGTSCGMFRSTNGGLSWREVSMPTGAEVVLSIVFSSQYACDRVIYAGTEDHGLLCSRNGGANWGRLAEHLVVGPVTALCSNEKSLFVIADGKVFLSLDGGNVFTCLQHKQLEGTEASALYASVGQKDLLVGLATGGIICVQKVVPEDQINSR